MLAFSSTSLGDQIQKVQKPNEFVFGGRLLSVSPELIRYNQIRLRFSPLAREAAERFAKEYAKKFHSLDAVISGAENLAIESLRPTWEASVEMLIDAGILHIDTNTFFRNYESIFDRWTPVFGKLQDQYAQIVCSEQELDEYRKRRRLSRGRIVGGGFGVAGAAKGMAIAGAANMAAGAAHMVFNGIGKLGSSLAASGQKNRIFKDQDTLLRLRRAVYDTAFACHLAVIKCFNREVNACIPLGVSEEQEKRAEGMLENLWQDRVPNAEKWKTLQASFFCNPYDFQWYAYVLKHFGDPKGELDAIASFFGLGLAYEKEQCIESEAQKLRYETIDEARHALQTLQSRKAYYHYSGKSPTILILEAQIEAYDRKQRTVALEIPDAPPIVFATIAEAEAARVQVGEIHRLLAKYDFGQEESCKGAVKILENMELLPALKESLLRTLHAKLEAFDLQERTGWGKVYQTREEAVFVQKEYAALIHLFETNQEKSVLDEMRSRIQGTAFPEKIRSELEKQLFEAEHRTEVTTVRSINAIAVLILIAMIAVGAYFSISATEELNNLHIVDKSGMELLAHDHEIKNSLTFADGLKNSIAVFGKSVVAIFASSFTDYVDGFEGTIDGHIVWLLLGWIKVLFENIWLGCKRYFVTLWYTFRQTTDPGYCLGYLFSTLFSWIVVFRCSADEQKQMDKIKKNSKTPQNKSSQ